MRTLIRYLLEGKFEWRLWILPLLVTCVIVPVTLSLPLVQRDLIDHVVLAHNLGRLMPTLALLAALWIFSSILQVVLATLLGYLDERLSIHLRRHLFAHCGTLSVPLWQQEQSGRTMTLFLSDVPSWSGFVGSNLVGAFGNVLTMLIGVAIMFQLNAQLALLALCFPAVVGTLVWLITRPLRRLARRVRDKGAELNAQLQENLSGLREIAAFGQERRAERLFVATMAELLRLKMHLAFVGALISGGQNVFSLVTMLAIIGFGGYLVIIGRTTLGTLLAMQQLFGQVYVPASSLLGFVVGAQQALSAGDRLHEFFALRPAVEERDDARDCGDLVGEVCFEAVGFAYDRGSFALRDVAFLVEPGDVVALVGPSGAGKSTLVSLIARFRDPQEGRILLDGVNLRDLTLESIRRQIAFVFQDPFLFETSIRENIALGRNDASEAEVIAAAKAACAWEFIETLPKGLDTVVGPRGSQLSEGQKQRVAIARALLRDPRILILDEPTSALDARSEYFLQQALENLMRGRTTFIIAHRLATVRRASRILVLDEGRLVEQGTHDDLLARRGLYHELHALQFTEHSNESRLVLAVTASTD